MNKIIYPNALKKGDKIAIISPAGSVEKASLENTLKTIESKGYEPVFGKYALGNHSFGYSYSGTEKQRISDLNWAFNDPEIAAIWASRGGYGCQHLIRYIKLKEFKKNPKWYIGYSDNTVINSFLLKNNFASIHGQTIKTASFGVCEDGYNLIFDILKDKRIQYSVDFNSLNKSGNTEGELIGGNLALVYALLGTKYSYTFKNKILFLEDIGENYYALDRMFMSLDLAGVFRKIKGLIIGGMTNMGNEKDNPNYESPFDEFAYELISKRLIKYDFPILFGFPNGHIYENKPLIIGANVKMEVGEHSTVSFE